MNPDPLIESNSPPASDLPPTAEEVNNSERAARELFGLAIQPYTPSRVVAAQSMGMLYPLIGEEGAAQFEQTGAYPGALKDCIILTWLCTLEDKSLGDWTPAKALARPIKALDAAMAWAESNDMLQMHTEKFQEAYNIFMEIVGNVMASQFDVKSSDERGGADPK